MIVSEVQHVWLLINLTLCLSTCVQVTVSEMPTCRQLIVVWQSAKRHACQLPIVMWQSAKYQLAYSIVWWQSAMFYVSISWLPLVNQLTATCQSADCHVSISWLPRVLPASRPTNTSCEDSWTNCTAGVCGQAFTFDQVTKKIHFHCCFCVHFIIHFSYEYSSRELLYF